MCYELTEICSRIGGGQFWTLLEEHDTTSAAAKAAMYAAVEHLRTLQL